MKNSDQYFEILFEPYGCYEAYLDFVISEIEDCIEEVSTPYHLETKNQELRDWNLSKFFSNEEQKFSQIIIRTLQNPLFIVELLGSFAQILSERMQEKIDFGLGYRVCQNKDWIEAYRQSILPVSVGGFYIRPSWHPQTSEVGLKDLVIDPALAFGSGHHASTAMCLEHLSAMDLKAKRLLDVGCGSGILGIAASMLGANVEICDTDELAIKESNKNFTLNHQKIVYSWVGSIASAQGEYDVIVANILASILIMLKSDLSHKLKKGGILILSGILSEYKQQVLDRFCDFEVDQILEKDEWVALKLIKLK